MRKQLGMISVLLITTFMGFALIIPVLPEIVSHFHMNMMLVIYSLVSFVMSPFWGRLSDRIGRKPVLMVGTIGFAASFLIFGLGMDYLWIMYLSRILGGFFSGAVAACAVAYVADITTEENRTRGMGLVGMSIGLGFIIGPAFGGFLSLINYRMPFFASSLLAFLTFLLVASKLEESLTPDKRTSLQGPKPSRWTAFQGTLKYLYVLSFFVSFSLAGLEGTLQFYNKEQFGADPLDIAWMFFISGVIGALIQGGVVRRYIKKGQEPQYMLAGLLLSAVGFGLLLFTTNFWTGALFLTVFSAGNSLIRPCVTSLITQKTTVGQGIATGLNSSMDSLGRIGGPLLGGLVYALDIRLPYVFGAVLSLLAVVLLYRFVVLNRTKA